MGYFDGNGDVPAAVRPLTGNERIPCSTNLPNGLAPQDEYLLPSDLRGFAITPVAVPFVATTQTYDAQKLAGGVGTLTLTGNVTLAVPTNLIAGQKWDLVITQDATGNRTMAYATGYLKVGGSITLTTTAAAIDKLTFTCVTAGVSPVILVDKGLAYA